MTSESQASYRDTDTDTDTDTEVRPGGLCRRLSFAQEQLWFLHQLTPGETAYNSLLVWRLRGPLRVDLLQRAITAVVARHEALRVCIRSHDGTPYQVVSPAAEVPLPMLDLRPHPDAEREERVRIEVEAQREQPFDLAAGPLCRFRLLRVDDNEHVLLEDFHHAVTDGWSTAILNADLSAAYRSLGAGDEPVFIGGKLHYIDFADAQRDRLRGAVLDEELAFWRERLADLPVLTLPADRSRPAGDHPGTTSITTFPDDVRRVLDRLATEHGVSRFTVLTAAVNVVLSRYTGLDDIPLGIPMLGRPEPEWESVVGMFVNMTVLRSDLSGDPSFGQLLGRVMDGMFELYDHQEVPFNLVVDAVAPGRDPDRNPLFQISLQLLDGSNAGENLDLDGISVEFVPLASVTSRFDVSLNVVDTGASLRAAVEHSSAMYDSWRIDALLSHVQAVLRSAAQDPTRRLSQIPLVTTDEAEQLLTAGRAETLVNLWPAGSTNRVPFDQPVYVVDRTMNLLPRGVAGELLVTVPPDSAASDVDGVIADPFQPGQRVYRTGVQARWTAGLLLEILFSSPTITETDPASGTDPTGVDPAGKDSSVAARATPTERIVAGIFAEVLAVPSVGAEANFFAAGGNSLQAMRVVSRVNKTLAIKLSVRSMYSNPTVRAVATAADHALAQPDGR